MSSLFGNTAQPATGSSLFGNPTTTSAPSGSSLFGNTSTSNAPSGGSLFGNTTQQNSNNNNNTGSSLFGGAAGGNAGGGGLFGSSTQQNGGTNTGASLFGGGSGAQQGGGLFGGSTQQGGSTNTGSSLFGGANNTPQQQQQQQQQQQPANNTSTSLFANLGTNTSTQQPPQSLAASTFPGFNPLSHPFPAHMTTAQQQDLARTRLAQSGLSTTNPSEKNILQQASTLINRWDPQAQDTLLQAYLYNAVSAAYAPFYNRNSDEDEVAWEKALAEAPKLPEETGQKFVPALARGFLALGTRIEYQAHFTHQLRHRLHEMNNSLSAIMDAHQQRISAQLAAARRQHAALAQRTLRLAVKGQMLRMRGYALDAQEEGLRKALLTLSAQVDAPEFGGREEEVWARMVGLRERGRWLEEEGRRVGALVGEAGQQQQGGGEGGGGGVPDEVLQKTQRILRDYDGQLQHLGRELEEVRREYAEWEASQTMQRQRQR
ncbi:hypothetical protein LTR85_003727 [Meristemomyces frigidus]|nr:hypothetical protein LTR85_003727 [Meristemomyces frigidus]